MFGIQTVRLKTNPIFGPIRNLEIDKRCTKNVIYLLFKFNEKGQNRNTCSNSYATHTKAAVQFGTLYYKDSFISFRKQQTCQSYASKKQRNCGAVPLCGMTGGHIDYAPDCLSGN